MSQDSDTILGAESPALFGVTVELVQRVHEALDAGDTGTLREAVAGLHPADTADLLEMLDEHDREALVDALKDELDSEVLAYLDDTLRETVIEHLETKDVAAAIAELDTDDAVDVLEDLEESEVREILDAVPADERVTLERHLAYPEKSAGRLMQREVVAVPENWTVGDTIDFARNSEHLPDDFYDIFVVDVGHRPIGSIPLSRLMRTRRPASVARLMDASPRCIPVDMDQEEVARLFKQYGLVSVPVVEGSGRLVGVVTVDDIVDLIDEIAEDDLMKLGGVSEDDLYEPPTDTARARFPWLVTNLVTAVIASLVIGLFESTIAALTALAVLFPIVASMGGNAGTQTLTVVVRALATRELSPANARRVVGKEFVVATMNGLAFALLTAGIAWFWFGDPGIAAVIAAATVVTLIIAGLSGALIPLVLERFKVDPAVASGVFLTTVTDVIGFFTFLGLASIFLL